MISPRLIILTLLAMIAFAGNSLLCRAALRDTGIDAASFTTLRLLSGVAMLWLLAVAAVAAGCRHPPCSPMQPAFPLPTGTSRRLPAHCCYSVPSR
jgi:hypothetical protein